MSGQTATVGPGPQPARRGRRDPRATPSRRHVHPAADLAHRARPAGRIGRRRPRHPHQTVRHRPAPRTPPGTTDAHALAARPRQGTRHRRRRTRGHQPDPAAQRFWCWVGRMSCPHQPMAAEGSSELLELAMINSATATVQGPKSASARPGALHLDPGVGPDGPEDTGRALRPPRSGACTSAAAKRLGQAS